MSLSYQDLCAFLYREARHLDDREWDEWLAMYAEDCPSGCRPGMTTAS
jgi:Small subunit of phenylpropionate dioxygenase